MIPNEKIGAIYAPGSPSAGYRQGRLAPLMALVLYEVDPLLDTGSVWSSIGWRRRTSRRSGSEQFVDLAQDLVDPLLDT
ncbi:hypothetical protein, partial [Aeromonas caviae]|uniref:hypothetical protein n=1 Tax=Aeromonas caviae TaxID=648 RepID=UPI002B466D4F